MTMNTSISIEMKCQSSFPVGPMKRKIIVIEYRMKKKFQKQLMSSYGWKNDNLTSFFVLPVWNNLSSRILLETMKKNIDAQWFSSFIIFPYKKSWWKSFLFPRSRNYFFYCLFFARTWLKNEKKIEQMRTLKFILLIGTEVKQARIYGNDWSVY